MIVTFEKREELAPNIWQYHFQTERPLDYVPGQYVSLSLPAVRGDRRGSSRTFTLTSLPGQSALSFAAKFEEPLSPYKQALEAMRPGNTATVGSAMGDVVLPKDPKVPLVFVAGGLGVASYVSILRKLTQQHQTREVRLFYAHRPYDEPFKTLLAAFPFASKHIAVSPQRLQEDELMQAIRPESLVYISGSEQFVMTIRQNLKLRGVAHEQIIFDFFDGYSEL